MWFKSLFSPWSSSRARLESKKLKKKKKVLFPSKSLLFEVWFSDQQYSFPLKACWECRFSNPTPECFHPNLHLTRSPVFFMRPKYVRHFSSWYCLMYSEQWNQNKEGPLPLFLAKSGSSVCLLLVFFDLTMELIQMYSLLKINYQMYYHSLLA